MLEVGFLVRPGLCPAADEDLRAEETEAACVGSNAARNQEGRQREPAPSVTAAWVIVAVFGIGSILGAFWLLLGPDPTRQGLWPRGIRLLMALAAAAIGAGLFTVALKIRQRRPWARWAGIVAAALVAAGSLQALFTNPTLSAVRAAVYGAAATFAFVVLARRGTHFQVDPAREADRHITTLRHRWRALESRSRLAVVAAGVVVVGGALWWASAGPGVSGEIAAGEMTCSVVHDGWVWPRREHTVILRPGAEGFARRVGPHRVTLEVTEYNGDQPRIRYRIEERVLLARSVGITGDWHEYRVRHHSTGFGELTIHCLGDPRPQPPGQEVETRP